MVEFARPFVDNPEKSIPHLWNKVLLPGVGHWTEQEALTEANRLSFLVSMDGKRWRSEHILTLQNRNGIGSSGRPSYTNRERPRGSLPEFNESRIERLPRRSPLAH